jgi:hypothetical protein
MSTKVLILLFLGSLAAPLAGCGAEGPGAASLWEPAAAENDCYIQYEKSARNRDQLCPSLGHETAEPSMESATSEAEVGG